MHLANFDSPQGKITVHAQIDPDALTMEVHAMSPNGVRYINRFPVEPTLADEVLRQEVHQETPLAEVIRRHTIEVLRTYTAPPGCDHRVVWVRGVEGATLVLDQGEGEGTPTVVVAHLASGEGRDAAVAITEDWVAHAPQRQHGDGAERVRPEHFLNHPDEGLAEAAQLIGKRLPGIDGDVELELRKLNGAWRWCAYRNGSSTPEPIRLKDALNLGDVYEVLAATEALVHQYRQSQSAVRFLRASLQAYHSGDRVPVAPVRRRILQAVEEGRLDWAQIAQAFTDRVARRSNGPVYAERVLGLRPTWSGGSGRPAYNVMIDVERLHAAADKLNLAYSDIGL